MNRETPIDWPRIFSAFHLYGEFVNAVPYGSGHINDTFLVCSNQAGTTVRFIFQRINDEVFKQPRCLMENIALVLGTARRRLEEGGEADVSRRSMTLVPARDGEPYHIDPAGAFWRCYLFIEGARSYDVVETTAQAYQAGKAFGQFQGMLVDLTADRIHETIPLFHDTPSRLENLRTAVREDCEGRRKEVRKELDFVEARADDCRIIVDGLRGGAIPLRVVHNDTKLNNVMLDNQTGEAVCVVDLDTVMAGSVLYDFGDLVRTSTSPVTEDEPDLSKVHMQMEMFEALTRGYLNGAGSFLVEAERELLAFSGKLITLEIGIRFLTDYLQGDRYFKTKRSGHNLDRCRTQFKLVESIEAGLDAMKACVREGVAACES